MTEISLETLEKHLQVGENMAGAFLQTGVPGDVSPSRFLRAVDFSDDGDYTVLGHALALRCRNSSKNLCSLPRIKDMNQLG